MYFRYYPFLLILSTQFYNFDFQIFFNLYYNLITHIILKIFFFFWWKYNFLLHKFRTDVYIYIFLFETFLFFFFFFLRYIAVLFPLLYLIYCKNFFSIIHFPFSIKDVLKGIIWMAKIFNFSYFNLKIFFYVIQLKIGITILLNYNGKL